MTTMDEPARIASVRSIVEAVPWTDYPDPLGTRVDLTEPLLRIALDRRLPQEARYYCSGLANHISLQGTMGELTLPVVRTAHRLLAAKLCVNPDLIYELLQVHSSSWTELEMVDPDSGERVVMWQAVFRELYRHKDLYLRDLDRVVPSSSPAFLDLLWLLTPKYPDIIDHAVRRAAVLEGTERQILESKIADFRSFIEEDNADHDYRYDIES
jgi:hypothetical protein